PGGRTFFWRGHYDYDLNMAHTDDTQLNVFGDFDPKLSEASRESEVLFLANIQPDLQRGVREQCANARFVAMDSMNLWIETARDSLRRTIADVDALLLNDTELRMLTEQANLLRAAPPAWVDERLRGSRRAPPGGGPRLRGGGRALVRPRGRRRRARRVRARRAGVVLPVPEGAGRAECARPPRRRVRPPGPRAGGSA